MSIFNDTFNFVSSTLGINYSKLARDIKVDRGTVSSWKNCLTPNPTNMNNLIKYLDFLWQQKHFNFYPKWENKEVTKIDFDFLVNGKIQDETLVELMRENYKQKEKELIKNLMNKVV